MRRCANVGAHKQCIQQVEGHNAKRQNSKGREVSGKSEWAEDRDILPPVWMSTLCCAAIASSATSPFATHSHYAAYE